MFQKIPKNRLIVYVVILGALPLILAFYHFFLKSGEINDLSERIDLTKESILNYEGRQSNNIAIRNSFKNSDHFYIDKQLEPLIFLRPEIEQLKKITQNKNFISDKEIEKRLYFLKNENHMTFSEGVVESTPFFQEVTETLTKPVEVNTEDIQKILIRIENQKMAEEELPNNPPQLIILDFKLDKKITTGKPDTFLLNLKLLKREFI
jgi:hypothetical protein